MEAPRDLNTIKRQIFFEFMNLAGRAFILVRHSDEVVLGNRGFTAEEKENGIVLVFNARMSFSWDDCGITATLVFGTSPQKCFIPAANIAAVYSSELNAQFVTSPCTLPVPAQKARPALESKAVERVHAFLREREPAAETTAEGDGRSSEVKAGGSDNVIEVDFTKKHKR
ncbi:MAG: hypothetical protein AB1805_10865 [Nitrospirota bacterium]